jgi:hypothetical protein
MGTVFYFSNLHGPLRPGVSNSKWLAGRMRLKVRTRGPHRNKKIELCVKNQFIWKNKQNDLCFLKSLHFFLMFAGCMWSAGRVFETPALDSIHGPPVQNLRPRARMYSNQIFESPRAQNTIFTVFKGCFYVTNWKQNFFGFVGHIKSFSGPHLAQGPCSVQAYPRPFPRNP